MLGTFFSKPVKGNLECHKCERVIPSRSHSGNCVCESIDRVPPNTPYSSHSNPRYLFEDDAAVIQITNKGRSPDRRTESIWMVVGATEFVSFYFDQNTCGQTISWRVLRQRMFATMQWHSWLTLRQFRRPYSSHDLRSFFSRTFSVAQL